MATSVLSSKGRLVIPVAVRRQAGLSAGDRVLVEYDAVTAEIRVRKPPSISQLVDELAATTTSWITPGTPPLDDPRAFYRTRVPQA